MAWVFLVPGVKRHGSDDRVTNKILEFSPPAPNARLVPVKPAELLKIDIHHKESKLHSIALVLVPLAARYRKH